MSRRFKRILVWTGIAAGVIVLLSGGFAFYLYNAARHTAAKMYESPVKPVYLSKDPDVRKQPIPKAGIQSSQPPEMIGGKEPFTVLVLGVDQRPGDRGRSDTMVVMTVNPAKKSILMFNVPRDTRTTIAGRGTVDKINHAYAFGGVSMSIQTVEQFIDYPIDYYIKVNMEGFARLIDLIGGVEVDNPFAFDYLGHTFAKGHLFLDGEEALLYSRMRYDDPRGDFGRNARQRDILKDLMKNAASLSTVTKIHNMLGELGTSVKTNITFDEMKTFTSDYLPKLNKFETIEIKGKGQTIEGIWYYMVSDNERKRIHDLMKNQMQ